MKICSKCKISKDESEFYKQSNKKDGLRCWCKSCQAEDSKRREPLYNATRRKYRADHPEEDRARKREYYKLNKDQINAATKTWFKSFKGRLLAYKRSAKVRDIEWKLTDEEFQSFWDKECHYCGTSIKGVGIDRINSAKSYDIENTVPCCTKCNIMKSDHEYDFFIEHIKKIFNNLKIWENIEK